MQGNEKSAGKARRKLVSGTSIRIQEDCLDRPQQLIKQTIVVVCVSIVLCVLISVMDSFILEGINLLMK